MLIGILLFMIIAPTNSASFEDIDEKGFTFFTWMCLFMPLYTQYLQNLKLIFHNCGSPTRI